VTELEEKGGDENTLAGCNSLSNAVGNGHHLGRARNVRYEAQFGYIHNRPIGLGNCRNSSTRQEIDARGKEQTDWT
jgi:hypothetical protein